MDINSLISFVRGLPNELVQQSAPDVAKAVHEALLVTINAHQAPDGTPWAPRKRGTAPVLNNAADAVSSAGYAGRAYISVRGINARHHKGAVRGSVQRPIILYKKHGAKAITPRIAAAIHAALAKRLNDSFKEAAVA